MAPTPCRLLLRTLAKALVSLPLSGLSDPGGGAVSSNCSSKAVRAACLPWLTSVHNLWWTFLELVVTALCAARVLASGAVEARSPSALVN